MLCDAAVMGVGVPTPIATLISSTPLSSPMRNAASVKARPFWRK